MDPLSVAASITGLLAAAGAVGGVLGPYIAAARDTPKIAAQVAAEVQEAAIALAALHGLTKNMAAVSIRRAALIQVDQVVAVLTDGVLIFSELESTIGSLVPPEASTFRVPLQARLRWARKESSLIILLSRLQGFKNSMSLILNILQSDLNMRAEKLQEQLNSNVNTLLQSDRDLSRRLLNLEDAFDAQSMLSKRKSLALATTSPSIHERATHPPSVPEEPKDSSTETSPAQTPLSDAFISSFDFESDLEASRVYRRIQRHTMDFSFRSSVARSHAWSVFSGLTLGDVSVISVIALPIYADDLTNSQHYFDEHSDGRGNLNSDVETQEEHPDAKPLILHCLEIELMLCQISGFCEAFEELALEYPHSHPLEELRKLFSKGYPFLMLLNAFEERWDIQEVRDWYNESAKDPKVAIVAAIAACPDALGIEKGDLFVISDVLGGGSDFLKVLSVLDLAVQRLAAIGYSILVDPSSRLRELRGVEHEASRIDLAVENFLANERLFLDQLVELMDIRDSLQLGLLSGDVLHEIFTPIRNMLDAQLRFLLSADQNLFQMANEQKWQDAFKIWAESASTYGVVLAGETRNKGILRAWLANYSHSDSNQIKTIISSCLQLLSAPSKHLACYEEFIEELLALSVDQSCKHLETECRKTAQMLQLTQEQIESVVKKKEESFALDDSLDDMVKHVEDWKNLRVDTFGRLLLSDTMDVVASSNNTRKPASEPYKVYLFEHVVLFCKETFMPEKKESRAFFSRKPGRTTRTRKLVIRGRVFGPNLKAVVPDSDLAACSCRLFFAGESGLQDMKLQFSSILQKDQWVEQLKNMNQPLVR